ncbi:PH domain-containing protein [Streptomyces sp. NBC_01237]|uniref:PH domain-containing protein n=1 Tax=Streptomyces sp. NBC_01237 TaxID=2903790 RepID=UPI002DDBB85E|nr:PH domain-containing protein [Streptomyces sp. NBC_01237]WRZ77212.1 PH domain-containing protein [Streptomyces sp. NBC_01237]
MSQSLEGRLHPVTPLRHSWAVLLALGTLVYQLRDLFSVGTTGSEEKIDIPAWAACVTAALAVALVVGLFATAWRHSHYSVNGNTLGYRSGLLFKVRHQCDLHHVQNVDILRPFLGRIIGICTLHIVMSGTTMSLSYLTLNQARALRARILAEDTAAQKLYQVKTRDLFISLLLDLGPNLRSVVLATIGLLPYILSGRTFALSTLIAFTPKVWGLTGKRLFVYSGWTVTRNAEGSYRADFGAVDAQQCTFRDTRVASIELHQPLLWRRFDWVRVEVEVAKVPRELGLKVPSELQERALGRGLDWVLHKLAGGRTNDVLVPVCPRAVAAKLVLHLLGPDAVAHLHEPIPAPPEARRATPFHRALGYRLENGYFTAWSGTFFRSTTAVCPAARVQTLTVEQGPWQRRLGLVTVNANMAGGTRVQAAHRTTAEAADLAPHLYIQSMRQARAAEASP